MPSSPAPSADAALRSARRLLLGGLALLLVAGLRHQLVWGQWQGGAWLLSLLHAFEGVALVAFVLLAGIGWWRALAAVDGRSLAAGPMVRASVPLLLLAVLVPCFLTADPIDYVVRGRLMAVHGTNPYLQVAEDFPGDPFLAFGDAGWKRMPLPYGPVVANLQAAVAWLAHQLPVSPRLELVAALALFKLVFAAALLLSATLLGRLADQLASGTGARAFVAVAWNPLLLDQCVANAHNEPVLLACLVVAVVGAVGSRFGVAVAGLGIGAMAKVVPLALGPLWLTLAVRRRQVVPMLLGALATAALAVAFYLQLFRDPAAFGVWRRQAELQGGSIWWAVHRLTGLELGLLTRVGQALVVLWVARACVGLWRRPEPRELLHATASTLLLLALLGAPLFGVWYHAWWVPFALLLRRGYLYQVACVVSVVGTLAFLPWAAARSNDAFGQWWIVAVAILLPLLWPLRRPALTGAAVRS